MHKHLFPLVSHSPWAKRPHFLACTLLLVCLFAAVNGQYANASGNKSDMYSAKNFTLENYRSPGQQTSLSDFKGKVVYLDFWASWCKPCRASFPWMNDMQSKYGEQGLEVVSINLDQEALSIATFLDSYPASFKILLDPNGEVASMYELIGMPSSYLIDKNGMLRNTHTGFFIKSKAQYEQEIVALLSE